MGLKRQSKYLLIALGAIALLALLAGLLVSESSLPLEDGAELAGGSVVIVADDSIGPLPTAAYLFRLSDGGLGLIDATADPEAAAVRAALARLGRGSGEVRAILFTHGHDDHTAGARAFPEAEVYALEGDPTVPAKSPWNRFQEMLPRPKKPPPAAPVIMHRLFDGEHLDLHGTTVEVFGLPGHTADSAAFLVHGVLFLGDSAGHSDGDVGAAPPIFSADRGRAQKELRVLAELLRERGSDVKHLAFGHQGPLEGLDPLLRWAEDQQ